MTILYNLERAEILSKYNPYYTVDGERVELEYPIIELDYIMETKPEFDPETQWLVGQTHTIDTQLKEYRISWVVEDIPPYELAMRDWTHKDFMKRITAPIELILDDMGIKMYGWFQVNEFPIETVVRTITVESPDPDNEGETITEEVEKKFVRLYCQFILPEHQQIADSFGDTIVIEDKPQSPDEPETPVEPVDPIEPTDPTEPSGSL